MFAGPAEQPSPQDPSPGGSGGAGASLKDDKLDR
jgi:hypothetical protein